MKAIAHYHLFAGRCQWYPIGIANEGPPVSALGKNVTDEGRDKFKSVPKASTCRNRNRFSLRVI